MTQLALLLALSLIGLVLSFGLGRMEVRRSAVSLTLKRAEGALERASVGLLALGTTQGLKLLALPALGLAVFAWRAPGAGSVSALGRGAFFSLALLAGAGSALIQGRFTLSLSTRAASGAAMALGRSSGRALRPLLRASLASAAFGEALGLLGIAAAFASLYAVRGGFAAASDSAELSHEVARLLPSFALGAGVMSLALSRAGTVVAAAARARVVPPPESHAAERGEPGDPALLAELVGQLTGELLPRALTGYVCGLSATASATLFAASGSDGGLATHGPPGVVLVVLVRTFGTVASMCGVFAARATDAESPMRALVRAQVSALLVALFGLGAALYWLQPAHTAPLFVAGALGLLSMAGVGQWAWLPLRRRAATKRELADARSRDAATLASSTSSSLASLWPALLVPALLLGLVERSLSQTTPPALLFLTFTAGALALSPFALSIAGFGLLAGHARGVATVARLELEPTRRATSLDEASLLGQAAGSTHASLALALSLLLGLWSLNWAGSSDGARLLGAPAFAATLGIALVLLFAARTTRSAVQGARMVSAEVERQLRGCNREPNNAGLPGDFTPNYKACVEAAMTEAGKSSLPELWALLAAPFLLASLLGFGASRVPLAPLLGFAVAAVLGALVFALAGRATRTLLCEARRRTRGPDLTLKPSTASEADSVGELWGVAAAASVEALGPVLALTVLCLAPLLH